MESIMFQGFGAIWTLVGVFYVLPVAYLVLRWRSYRESAPRDPHLGIKCALCFFRTIGYQVMLLGGFLLANGVLGSGSVRPGFSLLLSGGVIYLVNMQLLARKTNNRESPAVGRLFHGFNLVLVGLVSVIALIGISILVFMAYIPREPLWMALSAALVYLPAWAAQAFLFFQRADERLPAAPPPQPPAP